MGARTWLGLATMIKFALREYPKSSYNPTMLAPGFKWLLITAALAFSAAVCAADPHKVLHWEFGTAETGFDPAKVNDAYSNTVIEAINEPLLTYDYLARPAKLVPLVAEKLPEVSDGGKTYTIRIRQGIFFTPDPAFHGKKRELTAADFVYTVERLVDPKNRSPYAFLVAGKIVGLDDLATKVKAVEDRFDYDAKVPGLQAIDRYSLRIRLVQPDYNFAYILAMPTLGVVAREVIETYPDATMGHPVGTGPFLLKQWVPASKIILEANPDYRGLTWNFAPGSDPEDAQIVAQMRGKKMPQIGRVEIRIMEEEQSSWLAFRKGELDVLPLAPTFAPIALPNNALAPDLAASGVRLSRSVEPVITYTAFNIQDPVLGGLSKAKIALRRALAMAYDTDQEIRVIRNNQAFALQMPIPPGVVGYEAGYRSRIEHDVQAANRLLDLFAYRKGVDGWRTAPDGSLLTLRLTSETQSISRQYDELWKKTADSVGIRMEFDKGKFSDHIRAAKACQLQMWGQAWGADYPDGDNFMQLLYGPNTGQSNGACYRSPQFDLLYDKARTLPDSPERNKLYAQMSRQFEADTPWRLGVGRYVNVLIRSQVQGYKKHPIMSSEWLYMDLSPVAQ